MNTDWTNAQEFVERLPDAVAIIRDERFAHVNGSFLSLLRAERDKDLIGRPVAAVVSEGDQDRFLEVLQRVQETGRDEIDHEHNLRCENGDQILADISILKTNLNGGSLLLMLARDVSKAVEIRQGLLQSGRMASVEVLSSAVSHEINNPLAYILVNLSVEVARMPTIIEQVQAIAGERINDRDGQQLLSSLQQMRQTLEEAHDGAEKIHKSVSDLRRLARPDSGDKAESVNLNAIAQSAVNVAWNDLRHRTRLITSFNEIPPVRANSVKLGHALLDLLLSVAHTIPEGSASRNSLKVETVLDGEQGVVLELRHSGDDVWPNNLESVFDPLFGATHDEAQAGFGIAVCQRMIKSLGGTLAAHRQEHGEVVFSIGLPSTQVATPEPPRKASTKSRPLLDDLKVLVIDDNELVAKALSRLLSLRFGISDISTTNHGEEAVNRLLGSEAFDLVFCDLLMPDVTGMDVYERVVQTRPSFGERFVFMSGSAFTARAKEFIEDVPNPYIAKPFDLDRVEVIIHRFAAQRDVRGSQSLLYVEDDPMIRKAFVRSLSGSGLDIHLAEDPEIAINTIQKSQFAVVATDFDMPKLNGLELVQRIKRLRPETVCVLLTARRELDLVIDAVNLHEVSFIIPKPWDPQELVSLLQQAVELYRRRNQTQPVSANNNLADATPLDRQIENVVQMAALKHQPTVEHCTRVARYAARIAAEMSIDSELCGHLAMASRVFDLGKIVVPDAVLLKPGPLTGEERKLARAHIELGLKLLKGLNLPEVVLNIIAQHHERFDGSGYPEGLSGAEIFIAARILGLADAFDAITSTRPYRKPATIEEGLAIVQRGAGSEFDPEAVEALCAIEPKELALIQKAQTNEEP